MTTNRKMTLTCNLVSYEFTWLNFSNRWKEWSNLFLSHRLRKIIDNEVGLWVFRPLRGIGWRRRIHAVVGGWVVVVVQVTVGLLLRGFHSVHFKCLTSTSKGSGFSCNLSFFFSINLFCVECWPNVDKCYVQLQTMVVVVVFVEGEDSFEFDDLMSWLVCCCCCCFSCLYCCFNGMTRVDDKNV